MSSNNRYEAGQETKQQAHGNAVRELAKSRHRAKQALTQAEVQGAPPFATVVNEKPPEPNVLAGSHDYTPPDWASALRAAHAATLEYWSELKPYRDRAQERWETPLIEAPYPKTGDWVGRRRQQLPAIQVRPLEYVSTVVRLADLGTWRFQQVILAAKHPQPMRGTETIRRPEKVYLPLVACQHAYQQLNDILEEIGLAAEVREASGTDADPGVPDDVEAWE